MPPIIELLTQLIGALCCALILIRTEPALNRMGALSPPLIVRLAFALLVTGAIATLLAIISDHVPDRPTLILLAGTAALTLCERRVRLLSGTHGTPSRKGLPHA